MQFKVNRILELDFALLGRNSNKRGGLDLCLSVPSPASFAVLQIVQNETKILKNYEHFLLFWKVINLSASLNFLFVVNECTLFFFFFFYKNIFFWPSLNILFFCRF